MNDHHFIFDTSSWTPVGDKARRLYLQRLHSLVRSRLPASKSLFATRPLPFYPQARLLRLQTPQLEHQGAVLFWLLLGDDEMIRLDGEGSSFLMAFDPQRFSLNESTFGEYLRFLSFFARDLWGHLGLVLGEDDLPLILGSRASQRRIPMNQSFGPRITGEHQAYSIYAAPFVRSEALWEGHFSVTMDGAVTLVWSKEWEPIQPVPKLAIAITESEPSTPPSPTVGDREAERGDEREAKDPQPSTRVSVPEPAPPKTPPSKKAIQVIQHISPAETEDLVAVLQPYESLRSGLCSVQPVPELAPLRLGLQEAFPWFGPVSTWILQRLAVRAHSDMGFYFPPILLLGAPGIGKTAYANFLADLAGIPRRMLPLAGKSDNRDLVGTSRGWSTRHPSAPVRLIAEHRVANPLIILDELDKANRETNNGAITDALLQLLEPQTAHCLYDDFLCGAVDLSHVSWIATANSVKGLPSALLSRLQVFEVASPQPDQYRAIVQHAISQFARVNQMDPRYLPTLEEGDWQWLRQHFTSPRQARKATEYLLSHWLIHPRPGLYLH